jgi:hypothetical protein
LVGGVGIMNKRLQNKRNAEILPAGTKFPPPMRTQQLQGGVRKKNSMHLKLVHKAPGVENIV